MLSQSAKFLPWPQLSPKIKSEPLRPWPDKIELPNELHIFAGMNQRYQHVIVGLLAVSFEITSTLVDQLGSIFFPLFLLFSF
jgi:hypothetical protein